MASTAGPAGDTPRVPATWLRRVGAIVVDWGACALIASTLLPGDSAVTTLALFVVEQVVLVATIGSAVGHRLFGLRVERPDGGPAGLGPALVRTVLLVLVVPPLIAGESGRGLHDRGAGTRIVRRTGG